MKKLLIVLTVVILSGISCKKICACSPAEAYLFLIIKNSAGQDLLNSSTSGYYAKDQISISAERPNGDVMQIMFDVNPPISSKINYFQLRVSNIPALVSGNPIVYLKLGNLDPYILKMTTGNGGREISELLINGKRIPADKRTKLNTLFHLTL